MGKDYYKILGKSRCFRAFVFEPNDFDLGLTKGATDDDIKKAYRKL